MNSLKDANVILMLLVALVSFTTWELFIFPSIFLWNLLVSYIPTWLVHQHIWDMLAMFILLNFTCRDLWSLHPGPSNARQLRCLNYKMQGNFVSLFKGRILIHVPAWIWCPPLTVCHSISFSTEDTHMQLTDHLSHLLKAQPLPFYKQSNASQKAGLLFVDFLLAQLPFSLPRLHNKNNHSYCHPIHLPFLLPTLNFLLGICSPQFATLNFKDIFFNTQPRSF